MNRPFVREHRGSGPENTGTWTQYFDRLTEPLPDNQYLSADSMLDKEAHYTLSSVEMNSQMKQKTFLK